MDMKVEAMAKEPHQRGSPLTEEAQVRHTRTLRLVMEHWRNIRHTMPLQYVYTFLLVAEWEGKSVQEYADLAGVAQSVMSRHLLDLGTRNRNMEPGFGLVETRMADTDMRKHIVCLTPKGKALRRQLSETMERGL